MKFFLLALMGCTAIKVPRQYWEGPNNDRCYKMWESGCGMRLYDCDSGQTHSCVNSVVSGVEK